MNEVGSTSSLPPKTVDSAESLELAADMRLALLQIKGSHMDDSGKRVDYAAMRKSPVYRDTYLSAAQKLATIDLEALSANQRKAFFLNTYNSLVIHGMVEDNLGKVVTESLGRLKFYASQSYNIRSVSTMVALILFPSPCNHSSLSRNLFILITTITLTSHKLLTFHPLKYLQWPHLLFE